MPIIWPFIALAPTSAAACVSATTGHGMFGIGGATGPGNAANAGYHGMPGTLIVAVYESHDVPITFATVVVYLRSIGLSLGPCARMSGVSGGPTTWPTLAVGPMTITPTIVAVDCQVLHALQ